MRRWRLFFLFQLAAGGIFDSFISFPSSFLPSIPQLTAPVSTLLSTAQAQATSIGQQFQNLFQSFAGNLSSQINLGLNQFQQNFSYLDGNSQANACIFNQTQQYYSIGNTTRE